MNGSDRDGCCTKRAMVLALAVLLAALPAMAAKDLAMDVKRDALNLNGQWQSLRDHEDAQAWQWDAASGLGDWKDVEIPGRLITELTSVEQEGIKCVWARRQFTLDRAHASRQAVLKWNNILFGATVWINGQKIAEHVTVGPGTYMLPPGMLKDGANQIVIKATGWAGLARAKSGFPLVPAGASNTQKWGGKSAGISDDIWIEFYDRVYMKSMLAIPNLKDKKVTLRVWFDSTGQLPSEMELQATVTPPGPSDKEPSTIKLKSAKAIAAGKPLDFDIPIADPLAWTPQTPHLYTLKIVAQADGKTCDTAEFRFGMRQIAVEGGHYRLNGLPIWLRGSNLVGEWNWDKAHADNAKRYLIDEARLMNLGCFRTHTGPPISSWCDIADENGMLFVAEMPVLFNTFDMKFTKDEWDIWHANVLAMAEGYVRKLWNHPSVFTWNLSNESGRDNAWESGEYYQDIVALDPTRPPMRAGGSSGTPCTVDIHTCPNILRGSDGWAIVKWTADAARKDPKRTLGNSEYMNHGAPKQSLRWLGEAKLRDQAEIVYAQLGAEHTEAMRRLQFDLLLPYMYAGWTSFGPEPGTKTWRDPYPTAMAASLHSCMAPVLASLDLFDADYLPDAEVTTPMVLINELHKDVKAKIDIYVTGGNPFWLPDEAALKAAVSHESMERTLKADSITTEQVRWKVPKQPGTYYLAAVVTREGDRPVVSQREIRAIADPAAAQRLKGVKLVVLGADQAALKWLKDNGADVVTAVGKDKPQASAVIIWDARGVSDEQRKAASPTILEYVREGGRLAILDHPIWDWKDLVDLKLVGLATKSELAYESKSEAATSRAFPCKGMDKHPLLAGLPVEALRRWNGLPGTIADRCIAAGDLKDAKPILWSEDPKRIVAAEVPIGKGQIVICLLHARNRLEGKTYDPVAVQIMLNLLAPTGR